jgi:hypothetical protein
VNFGSAGRRRRHRETVSHSDIRPALEPLREAERPFSPDARRRPRRSRAALFVECRGPKERFSARRYWVAAAIAHGVRVEQIAVAARQVV